MFLCVAVALSDQLTFSKFCDIIINETFNFYDPFFKVFHKPLTFLEIYNDNRNLSKKCMSMIESILKDVAMFLITKFEEWQWQCV